MDTDTYHRLMKHSNEAGAKLVLLGESEQLAAVGFGGHLKTLSERFHTAKVTDINRQKDQLEREMVEDFASGRSHKAIKYLHEQGRVVITDTTKERVAKLVDDYFASKHKTEDKIVVAATNEDVDNLNDAIRERLKAQKAIGQDGVTIKGKDGFEREFSIGDKVIFTKKAKSEDLEESTLNNADIGEVKEFRKGARGTITSMKLKMGDGKEVWISANKEQPLKHAYAVTIHKSQGQTKAQSFYFVSSNLNSLNQAYVACSRHKETVTMYLSKDQVDIMTQKMDERAPTAKMLEVAGYVAKNMGIQIPEEATNSFNACREFLNQKYEKVTSTPTKTLDLFINIVESMSQAQFKKTSFDFDILDGKHRNTYEAVRLEEAKIREQEKLRQKQTQRQGISV
jgi:ATP-dependent exoDNAse (exonuclease V) alpha subunit